MWCEVRETHNMKRKNKLQQKMCMFLIAAIIGASMAEKQRFCILRESYSELSWYPLESPEWEYREEIFKYPWFCRASWECCLWCTYSFRATRSMGKVRQEWLGEIQEWVNIPIPKFCQAQNSQWIRIWPSSIEIMVYTNHRKRNRESFLWRL